ncbi:MAG TPA: tRNA 2-thiocytidine(32) synthetase TtcA, partial [Rhodanobacteraceae bacterium]|nr:tRNA 2-thiocytidine(32) synthetase TtcA [Rhodanobacteraceae bacterium]
CNLCGSQENLQRKQARRMLDAWEREHPGRSETIFRALCNVAPSQLADPKLFDFAALGSRGETPLADAHAWLSGAVGAGDG